MSFSLRDMCKHASLLALTAIAALQTSTVEACVAEWQPESVEYIAPERRGGMATLRFGPETCYIFYHEGFSPVPSIVVDGGDAIFSVGLVSFLGVGVSPPSHFVEVPIPPIAQGDYSLTVRYTINDTPMPEVTIPLAVSAGDVFVELPVNSGLLIGAMSAVLFLTGFTVLRRRRLTQR